MEYIGKLEQKFLEAGRQESFDKVKQTLLDQVNSITVDKGEKELGMLNPTLMQKLKDGLDKHIMDHNRVDFLVKILDNF